MGMKSDLKTFFLISQLGGFGLASANPFRDKEAEKLAFRKLGDGFELRPIKEDDELEYSHLYKDGVKISNEVFRRGGICSGFKDGYCQIIQYQPKKDKKKYPDGYGDSRHVIVNAEGKIVLSCESSFDSIYHTGGNVASKGDVYYNLLTGEPIIYKSSTTIKGAKAIIIEHRYDFDYMKKVVDVPKGVYSLDLITCELTKIDDIR